MNTFYMNFRRLKAYITLFCIMLVIIIPSQVFGQSPLCESYPTTFCCEYVSSVTINGVTRAGAPDATGFSSGPGYFDYTGTSLTSFVAGNSYPVSVTAKTNSSYQEFVKIWVDFNGNGNLSDAGELVFDQVNTFNGTHVYSGNITIPATAFNGDVYIRVVMVYANSPALCGTYSYGTTLDFKATISGGVSASNLSVSTTESGGYNGNIVSSPTGINTGSSMTTANYPTGTNVTLTATPNSGGYFLGWSGDATGTTNPLTVAINSDMNITANFGSSAPNNPTSISASSSTICNGSSTSLTANGAEGTVYWYTGSCGGSMVGTGNPINVSPTTTTTYYARNFTTAFSPGCASTTVTVHDGFTPGAIQTTGETICYNEDPGEIGSSTAASGGDESITYQWQSSLDAGFTSPTTISTNAATYNPSNLTTSTWFRRQAKDATCNTAFEMSTGTWKVTVNDLPVAKCQDTTVYIDAFGSVSIDSSYINYGSTYDCGLKTMALNKSAFSCANIGENTVTLTITDLSDNTDFCTSTVTVKDTVSPAENCQNITVYLDSTGSATIDSLAIDNGTYDNCGLASHSLDISSFDCNNVGANTITMTVTDVNSNVSTCSSTVTVEDTIAPVAICKDTTIYLDSTGNISIDSVFLDNGSDDICGIASITLNKSAFDCSNVGVNTVEMTVLDMNSNVSTCSSTVTVLDTIAPIAVCTDTLLELDINGQVSISAADFGIGSDDACSIDSMGISKSDFNCADIGVHTDTLTVVDASGNQSVCIGTITVEDNINPTATANDTMLYLNADGLASLSPESVDDGSDDNCGIDTMYLSKYQFDCSDVGLAAPVAVGLKSAAIIPAPAGQPVLLTVMDGSGNSASDWFWVTVLDTISPVALCQDIVVGLDENAEATITPDMIDMGSNDACGILSLSLDSTDFTVDNMDTENTVVLTVIDNNDNVSTCSARVIVADRLAPLTKCNTMDFVLSPDGQYELTAEDIDALAKWTTDNISAYEDLLITVSPNVFTCEHIGGTTIRVYAEDEAGNGAFCTVDVGVSQINVAPTIDNIANKTANENASVSIELSGITDGGACEAQDVTVSASYSNASLISSVDAQYTSGDNTGTLNVELVPGQIGSAEIIVTIEDEMGASVADTFMLTVVSVNHSPVLVVSVEDQNVKAEETLELSLSKTLGELFDDSDDDALAFSVLFEGDTLPSWVNTSEDDSFYFVSFAPEQADSGCYNVVVKASDSGNLSASDTFAVCVQPILVGINDLGAGTFEVSMYPNPSKGQVTIETGTLSDMDVEVAVMNIAGSEVFRKKYQGGDAVRFNLSEQVSGIYMVLIEVEGQRVVKKLILDKK